MDVGAGGGGSGTALCGRTDEDDGAIALFTLLLCWWWFGLLFLLLLVVRVCVRVCMCLRLGWGGSYTCAAMSRPGEGGEEEEGEEPWSHAFLRGVSVHYCCGSVFG